MGTITRNFANNLTTSGLLKPTAFNNDSFDNVTAVPSGSVETGDMQFISSATASASASIDFTSGIDSTYKNMFFILKYTPSASRNFNLILVQMVEVITMLQKHHNFEAYHLKVMLVHL
jgi:hypothetical protein